jgi:hypothetical protein
MKRGTTRTKSTTTNLSRLDQSANELIVERTRTLWEPVLEIRKAATLAPALTEPEAAVIKPKTKTIVTRTIKQQAG